MEGIQQAIWHAESKCLPYRCHKIVAKSSSVGRSSLEMAGRPVRTTAVQGAPGAGGRGRLAELSARPGPGLEQRVGAPGQDGGASTRH